MHGKTINQKQVNLFMSHRKQGDSQIIAAAKADISVRSARRIEHNQHSTQPKIRQYKTRKDPLGGAFEKHLLPLLNENPQLLPMTLFEELMRLCPDQFDQSCLRTIQRRVKTWRATEGPEKEVMFLQKHTPGLQGISDYTHLKNVEITINNKPFKHILYHYRLVFSGWTFVQVVLGGESFESLSSGLQNAFWRCGGVPLEHRTDSLSAAFKNHYQEQTLTERYHALSKFYGFTPTRNNPGIAHENGSIEANHGHLKRRIEQALILRQSADFDSLEAYQSFLDGIVNKINRNCKSRFEQERPTLQSLPARRTHDFSETYVKVTSSSTITIRRVLYTVPSRLIAERLLVHIFDDHLDVYLGHQKVMRLDRIHAHGTARERRVNYRHVIHSLAKKPNAFKCSQLREDIIPDGDFTLIWKILIADGATDTACHYMVNLLLIASNHDCEYALARMVLRQLEAGMPPTIEQCRSQFEPHIEVPKLITTQHSLSTYDELMGVNRG